MPSKNRKNPYFMPTLAIIFSSLLLTSCSTGKDAPTSQIKQVTDGVEKDSGSVAIRGLLLVSQPDGSAVLVGTIVNSAADADSIVSIAVGGVAAPITGAPLPLAQNAPVIFGGDSANASSIIAGVNKVAGQRVPVEITFGKAAPVKLDALVVEQSGVYAGITK